MHSALDTIHRLSEKKHRKRRDHGYRTGVNRAVSRAPPPFRPQNKFRRCPSNRRICDGRISHSRALSGVPADPSGCEFRRIAGRTADALTTIQATFVALPAVTVHIVSRSRGGELTCSDIRHTDLRGWRDGRPGNDRCGASGKISAPGVKF